VRAGGRKDLCFLVRRERRPVAGDAPVPGERVEDGLLDRPEAQAGSDRTADVRAGHACVVGSRQPERQLRPRLHTGVEDVLLLRPEDVGVRADRRAHAVEELGERQPLCGAGGVEDAARALEREPYEPRGEVARVDELHRRTGIAGPEHVAACSDPPRPVREPVGRVVRPDDQPGADARAAIAVCLVDDALARGLQSAVALEDILGVGVIELRDRRRLGDRAAEVPVDGDARDEDVSPDGIAQQLCRLPHDARHVAARVDHAVPCAPGERTEIAVAVSLQVLDLREELGVRLPACEDRHLVPARERRVDRLAAEELRASEDEQLHAGYRSIARPMASTPNASASTGTRSSALWTSGYISKSSGSLSGSHP
jgi:hypothetical protein